MTSKLKYIPGIEIPTFPIKLEKVGDLLYFDGELTSVFKDGQNNPYIFDWGDSDSESNRWIVYQTQPHHLSDYIYGRISHLDLINNPHKDVIFIVDKKSNGEISNCYVTTTKNIPYDYLPKQTSKFEEEDSVNLDKIISTFELQNISIEKVKLPDFDILEEAKINNTELINLHVKSKDSTKVGFGKIRSSILGSLLSNYQKLSEATAVNLFDDKGKLPKEERVRRKHGELSEIKLLGETEFLYVKAASFSAFLKPIKQNQNLFDNKTTSENITESIFKLFEASEDSSSLNEIKNSLSDEILTSYNNLLKEIKESDITLSIQYANPNNNVEYNETFDVKKASTILKNLDILEIGNSKDYKVKGFFKALDSISFTFKFESLESDIFEGKFSDQIKPGMFHYNLRDHYSVTIKVEEIKSSGKNRIKEKHTMVSCVKIE